MKNITLITITFVFIFTILGCFKEERFPSVEQFIKNKNLTPTTSPSGLIYEIYSNGNGEFPLENSKVVIKVTTLNTKDEVTFQTEGNVNSYLSHEPILVEAITLLSKGGSGIFIITSKYLENLGYPSGTSNDVIYEIELIDILPGIISLDEYIATNNLDVETTDSGLRYIITKEGNGNSPTLSSNINVKYSGYYTNGDVFDQTTNNKSVNLNLSNVIPGWQEGLQLMSEGGKAKLLIPSNLGYGDNPNNGILPNVDLIFDITLEKVN